MNEALWQACIAFHGHECGGLAIGYRASEVAMARLGIDRAGDEELVCVTENDACGVDAVQVMTGCTFGKGNLIYRGTGKQAFSFFRRSDGGSIRLVLKPYRGAHGEEKKRFVLTGPEDEVFAIGRPGFALPEKARIFQTVICERCGEGAPEHRIRLENGQKLCLDCAKVYSRGFGEL